MTDKPAALGLIVAHATAHKKAELLAQQFGGTANVKRLNEGQVDPSLSKKMMTVLWALWGGEDFQVPTSWSVRERDIARRMRENFHEEAARVREDQARASQTHEDSF